MYLFYYILYFNIYSYYIIWIYITFNWIYLFYWNIWQNKMQIIKIYSLVTNWFKSSLSWKQTLTGEQLYLITYERVYLFIVFVFIVLINVFRYISQLLFICMFSCLILTSDRQQHTLPVLPFILKHFRMCVSVSVCRC